MKIGDLEFGAAPIPGAAPAWRAEVDASQWGAVALRAQAGGGRLVALWASDRLRAAEPRFAVHAALLVQAGLVIMTLPLAESTYPDLSNFFPAANRMQRAV